MQRREQQLQSDLSIAGIWRSRTTVIAALSVAAIFLHLILRFSFRTSRGAFEAPLLAALILGGVPLVYQLLRKLLRREFGSDLLAGISIVTSVNPTGFPGGSIS